MHYLKLQLVYNRMAGESKKLYAEDDISKLAVLKSTDSIPQKVNNYLLQGVQKILKNV